MYMHPDEEDPHRTVQNKNAIHKVMFYSGVTQPRFDAEGRCYFDGKLGVWPFVRELGSNLRHVIFLFRYKRISIYIICHTNLHNFRNQHKEVAIGRGAHLSQRQ